MTTIRIVAIFLRLAPDIASLMEYNRILDEPERTTMPELTAPMPPKLFTPPSNGSLSGKKPLLQQEIADLGGDVGLIMVLLTYTARHPHRTEKTVSAAWTRKAPTPEPYIEAYEQNGGFFLEIGYNNTVDKAQLPSLNSLENLIDVLGMLKNGNW